MGRIWPAGRSLATPEQDQSSTARLMCDVQHKLEVQNVHQEVVRTKLHKGEDKQIRTQTNTKAAGDWTNAGAREVHRTVRETTKGGKRPEESKLFHIHEETNQTGQLDASCCQFTALSHFSDL